MPERDVRQELELLVNELCLSREEAYATLGLNPDGDPLVSEDVHENCEQTPVEELADMFPAVPITTIEQTLQDHNGDVDKASEQLLSWGLMKEETESQKPSSTRESKHEKLSRKSNRKVQKALEYEESDISVISTTLKIPIEEARELYWTHEYNVSEVLLAKAPKQPLTTKQLARTAAGLGRSTLQTGPYLSQKRAADLDLGDYGSLSYFELKGQIEDATRRLEMLHSKYASRSNKQSWDLIRASDTAAEIRHWQSELRMMQLALHKSEKLRSSGVISGGTDMIDLHGCTLDQAKAIVSDAIQVFKQSPRTHLEIITGAGRHSAGGKAVLKTWLRSYLKKANVRMEELEGSFVISQSLRI